MPRRFHWTLAAILLVQSWQADSQQQAGEPNFIINPNRAYLYVRFDHFGPGDARAEGEARNRVWLRLVNNCSITIQVRVNGFAEGHRSIEEVAIMDSVVKNEELLTISGDEPNKAVAVSSRKPSYGYGSDVGSPKFIAPGKDILFSLPTSPFDRDWHIEIPYKFALPVGKGPRPEDIGGEPIMFMRYDFWSLPKEIQQEVERENGRHS
jgi:hypothetical protein